MTKHPDLVSSGPIPNIFPMSYQTIIDELLALENRTKAKILAGFFKTGSGQYGEGDVFLGITVPLTRGVVKKHGNQVSLSDIEAFLSSPFHEIRLAGVLFLVQRFEKAQSDEQEEVFRFYLDHTGRINNWDLVDQSAPNIVGAYLFEKNRDILSGLSRSENLWERRISVVATLHFIRKGEYDTAFSVIENLLSDRHDLIHKANGWMLREIGKRCGVDILEGFLRKNYPKIPRTTLRYAIERLTVERRKYWMGYGRA